MQLFAALIDPKSITLFSQPQAWLKTHGVNVLIIILGAWLLRRMGVAVIMGIFKRAVRSHPLATGTDRKKRLDTLDSLVNALSKIIIWMVAVIMIVGEIGINTTPLVASAGIAGVALGIGAQSL